MKKSTAKVQHRDYVPAWWIAVEFCDVEFYGYRADEMENKWSDIEHERYEEYDIIYKQNKIKIQELYNESSDIRKQVQKIKPFYRLWYNKTEKEMLAKAHDIMTQAIELEIENKEIGSERFFPDVYECRVKIEKLLRQNGFVLINTSSEGDECVTQTDIWILEE